MSRVRIVVTTALSAAALLIAYLVVSHHLQERHQQEAWQNETAAWRARYPPGTTRAQVKADLTQRKETWTQFGGGSNGPDENPFQDSILLGTAPNRFCGTTVYAHAIVVYRRDMSAEVLTDEPNDPVSRISLEETDECGET